MVHSPNTTRPDEPNRQHRGFRFISWNVRSLRGLDRFQLFSEDVRVRRPDIATLQETRLDSDTRSFEVGEGVNRQEYVMVSQKGEDGYGGVGILVKGELQRDIRMVRRVSERIIAMELKTKPMHVHVISAYAPQSGLPYEEITRFWRELTSYVRSIPHNAAVFLGMDANAQARRMDDHDRFVGKFAYVRPGEQTVGDLSMRDFLQRCGMTLCNTRATPRKGKLGKNATYRGPRKVVGQIDFVATRCRLAGAVLRCQPAWGTHLASDHAAIVGVYNLRLASRAGRMNDDPKPDVSRLRIDPGVRLNYARRVEEYLGSHTEPPNSLENVWQLTQRAMRYGLEGIPREVRRRDGVPLSLEAIQAGEEARRVRLAAPMDRHRINQAARRFRALARRDGQREWERLAEELRQANNRGDTRTLFKLLRRSVQATRKKKLVTEEEEAATAAELNALYHQEPTLLPDQPTLPHEHMSRLGLTPPTREELERAVSQLRSARAPGHDGVTPPMFQAGGQQLHEMLFRIATRFFVGDALPQSIKTGKVILIPKGGGQHRAITIMPAIFAMIERIVLGRLKQTLPPPPASQFGAVAGRSVAGAVQTLTDLLEQRAEGQLPSTTLLIDFSKAYDRLRRSVLWEELERANFPSSICQDLYEGVTSQLGRHMIKHERGLLQGGVTSPLLFTFILEERVMKPTREDLEHLLLDLGFIDDLALVLRTLDEAQVALQTVHDRADPLGLTINPSKTVAMPYPRPADGTNTTVELRGRAVQVSDTAKYLGTVITARGTACDATARIEAATRAFFALRRKLTLKGVNVRTRCKLYAVTVRSILLYNVETWGSDMRQYKRLIVADNRMVRIITEGWRKVTIEGEPEPVYRPISNTELFQRAGISNLDECIRRRIHRWVGHVARGDVQAYPMHQLIKQNPGNWKRKKGGQRMTWRRRVARVYRKSAIIVDTGTNGWCFSWSLIRRKARDRQGWKNKVSQLVRLTIQKELPANRAQTSR